MDYLKIFAWFGQFLALFIWQTFWLHFFKSTEPNKYVRLFGLAIASTLIGSGIYSSLEFSIGLFLATWLISSLIIEHQKSQKNKQIDDDSSPLSP